MGELLAVIYEHYYPKEMTLKEKILDKAFQKSIDTNDVKEF